MASKLNLKTERLTELTTDDLNRVAGAATATAGKLCLSLVGWCPSWQHACTTAMSCGCEPTWDCA